MARMVEGASRVRLALVAMVSGTLTLLVPSLSASSSDTSVLMVTAVAALIAAFVGHERHLMTVVRNPLAGPVYGADQRPPFLAARVTDTTRHPLRPRAPGLA